MQVDVNNRAVLILLGWKNDLKRTKAEGLTHRNIRRVRIREKKSRDIKQVNKNRYFLTTWSCPGGGKGTSESLAENSLIVSSKSDCLACRNSTRRLRVRREEMK